jgi:undecaprenyl-diphosphatase
VVLYEIIPVAQAALLGVIEGLTEFIPVSSTGHLILAGHLLGLHFAGNVFEVFIQLGAILAIVFLYREKFLQVAITLPHNRESQRFTRNILLAFVPSLILGVLAHGYIKAVLFNPTVVAVALIIGGVAILLIERFKPAATITSTESMGLKTVLMIGCFQCIAMIPGVSRSGATIMGALLCKVERKAAAEFSFFLAVPTMLGAVTYDLYKNFHLLDGDQWLYLAVGFVSAFITARLVVRWVLGFVQQHGFQPFAYYRIAIGTLMLLVL